MRSLATNITLTNTFTDIGPVIGPDGSGDFTILFSFLTIAVELAINNSLNFQIRALALDSEDNVRFEFPIKTVKKDKVLIEPEFQELNVDIDINQLFQWELDTTIDAIQLQVRVGTEGATPGVVTSIRYNLGYRQ